MELNCYERESSIPKKPIGVFSYWEGKWTFRVHVGRLWIGANLRHPAAFAIWNGPTHKWQLQTWRPFAHAW